MRTFLWFNRLCVPQAVIANWVWLISTRSVPLSLVLLVTLLANALTAAWWWSSYRDLEAFS